MNSHTKALLGNLLSFGSLFVFCRIGLDSLFDMPTLVLFFIAGIVASLSSPKFLVHKNRLYMKYPWKKDPREF